MTGKRIDMQDRDGRIRLDSLRAVARQQQKLGNLQPAAGTEFLDLSTGLLQAPAGGGGGDEIAAIPILCGARVGTSYTFQAKLGVCTPGANGVKVNGGADVYLIQCTHAAGSESGDPLLFAGGVFLGCLIGTGDPAHFGESRPVYGAFEVIDPDAAGGGLLTVTDGTTNLTAITELNFVSGEVVAGGGAGIANIAAQGLFPNFSAGSGSSSGANFNSRLGSLTLRPGSYLVVGNITFPSGDLILSLDAWTFALDIDDGTSVLAGQGYSQGAMVADAHYLSMSVSTMVIASSPVASFNLNFRGKFLGGFDPLGTFFYNWTFQSIKIG